jgi:hypothetical protein
MDGDHGLSNLRFEGYSNADLADQVDGLRNGPGSESLHGAMKALVSLAAGLAETDRVLRQQLQEIGVTWQGEAADRGVEATKGAAVYADEAVTPVNESAKGVASQSGSFSHTRDSAPESSTLNGPTELNGFDRFAGVLGHTTDHAQDVKATNAAREAAIAGLNGYQSGSSDALGRAQTLPVPPGMNLVTTPASTGTSVSGVGPVPSGGGGYNPSGAPGGGGPGSPGFQGGAPGPFTGVGPLPGGGGPNTPGLPGTPGAPGPVPGPSPNTGVGPVSPPAAGLPTNTGPGVLPRGVPSVLAAETAGLAMAGAGGAAAGADAEKDRLVRSRPGGATPASPEAGKPKPGTAALGAPLEDEARSVRNAERFGAKPGKPAGPSLLQPAAGSAPDEEDTEHVRKYGVDSGDVFDDERLIAPSLIGDEDD